VINIKLRILLLALLVIPLGYLIGRTTTEVEAKPEPQCKKENAECKTNDSNKLCCEGLVCMDKGVPSENGKCQALPTPTPTPLPTPTPTLAPVCPTWTCGECQGEDNVEVATLRIEENSCQKEKQYCEKTYGCKEVCPDDKEKCKKDEKVWECNCPVEPTPTPEVTPTPEPTNPPKQEESKPEGCTSNCDISVCTDTTPQPVTNPHIYRSGDCAIVKYWPSSDKVNIYWRLNSSSEWEHSLANQPATGNHEVCGLNGYDYTFGVQSVSGCTADGVVNASNISEVVDGATSKWILFR